MFRLVRDLKCDNKGVTMIEYALIAGLVSIVAIALLSAMGSDLPLEFGPPRGVNAVTRRLADVSLAAERLGWKAEVGLDEGLRRLVGWWRAQREAAGSR